MPVIPVPLVSLSIMDAYVLPPDDKGIPHVVVAVDPQTNIMSIMKIQGKVKSPLVATPIEAATTMVAKLPSGVGAFLLAL